MRIVVIGGTGFVGSKLVHTLDEHGHDVVAAAPSTGVNTFTGEGLAEVLAGASVVVDVSNSPTLDERQWNSSARRPPTCSPPRRTPGSDITSRCRW